MTKVKICGLRRHEDIACVNKYKPDFIGFIFAESKRRMTYEDASMISFNLDPDIKKAGVFVNDSTENIVHAAKVCKLDIVQVHGNEPPEYVSALKRRLEHAVDRDIAIWKAIRVKDADSTKIMMTYNADAYLFDTYVEGSYGGTGKSFDWRIAADAKRYGKIIIAGGIDITNVGAVIEMARPYAVDVSSSLETEGYKDESKIRDFMMKVRSIGE